MVLQRKYAVIKRTRLFVSKTERVRVCILERGASVRRATRPPLPVPSFILSMLAGHPFQLGRPVGPEAVQLKTPNLEEHRAAAGTSHYFVSLVERSQRTALAKKELVDRERERMR